MSEQVHLYRNWCSFPDCIGYGTHTVDLNGPIVCRKHAREVRQAQKTSYLTRLLRLGADS